MITVVRGNPTPEELAVALAVVARLAAASSAGPGAGHGPRAVSAWSDPARAVPRRGLPTPGPQAWARSFWPS